MEIADKILEVGCKIGAIIIICICIGFLINIGKNEKE
jgi:hypothetical protein